RPLPTGPTMARATEAAILSVAPICSTGRKGRKATFVSKKIRETRNVPRNKLNGKVVCGYLTSLAANETLLLAAKVNRGPIMATRSSKPRLNATEWASSNGDEVC